MKTMLSILAFASLAISAVAADATPAPAAKPLPFNSTVTALAADGKGWTHTNADGKVVTFVVGDQTVIKNGKADAKFADIKVGDEVDGSRTKTSDTEYQVVKITRFGPKAPKAKKGS